MEWTWNDLPEDVTSAESLTTFRRLLKTHLFRKSFPDYLLDINWLSPVELAVVPLVRPPKNCLIDWLNLACVAQINLWNTLTMAMSHPPSPPGHHSQSPLRHINWRRAAYFPYTLHCTGERCETGNDVQQQHQQQLLQVDNTPICQVCYYMTLSIHSRNKLTSVNESRAITN